MSAKPLVVGYRGASVGFSIASPFTVWSRVLDLGSFELESRVGIQDCLFPSSPLPPSLWRVQGKRDLTASPLSAGY